jgi:hypothetical protein
MSTHDQIAGRRDVALVDLLDRLMAGGVVIGGDITLAIADVDLVYVGLRAIINSVAGEEETGVAPPPVREGPPA